MEGYSRQVTIWDWGRGWMVLEIQGGDVHIASKWWGAKVGAWGS